MYLNLETLLALMFDKGLSPDCFECVFQACLKQAVLQQKSSWSSNVPSMQTHAFVSGHPLHPFWGFFKINFIKILPVLVNEPQLVMIWFLPPFLKFLQQAHNQNKSTTRGFPAAMTSRRPSPFPASKQKTLRKALVSAATRASAAGTVRCNE